MYFTVAHLLIVIIEFFHPGPPKIHKILKIHLRQPIIEYNIVSLTQC